MNGARLSEAIAYQIAELILSGEIENETKLRQEELAATLQVSRIPVREALQILETQGLVQRLATRHVVSANLEDAHIREIYRMIAAIEQQAITAVLQEEGPQAFAAEADDMTWHHRIMEKTKNLYVQTLLKNAIHFYVAYAERLPKEQQVVPMRELLRALPWEEKGSDLLQEHYRLLAQAVITERRKHYDRTETDCNAIGETESSSGTA